MMIAIKLKKSWTVEAEKALLNSLEREICARDTSVLVMLVPTFAPIMMGIAP